jgi:hypothetical protein
MAEPVDKTDTAVGTAEDVDTSSKEGVDYDSDNLFEDIEVDATDEVDTEGEEEAEAATEAPAKPDEPTDDESEEDVEEEGDKPEDSKDSAETDAKALEEERKRHNDEMAKARIAEREARQQAEETKRVAREAELERYLKEAEHDEDELAQRKLDVREYRLKERQVQINSQALETEVTNAYNSIALFKTGTPAVQARLLRALDAFEASNIVKDNDGRPLEVKGSIYKYLQDEANAIAREQEELRAELLSTRSTDKAKQSRRTTTIPSKAPQKKDKDPGQDAFDEEISKW